MPMKLITSVKELDTSKLRMPAIVVYEHPKDYPQYYVARVFDADKPTDTIMLKDRLSEIQDDIKENADMIFFLRGAADDPCMVGAWM